MKKELRFRTVDELNYFLLASTGADLNYFTNLGEFFLPVKIELADGKTIDCLVAYDDYANLQSKNKENTFMRYFIGSDVYLAPVSEIRNIAMDEEDYMATMLMSASVKEMHAIENKLINGLEVILAGTDLEMFIIQATVLKNLIDGEVDVVCASNKNK